MPLFNLNKKGFSSPLSCCGNKGEYVCLTIELTGFATRQDFTIGDDSFTGRIHASACSFRGVANSVLSELLAGILVFLF
ncbi:hypothetical protein Cabys_4119 [Caldithrix abyssi DSM 13497]|uniref:Uncharacterized protein n=1 Tax=Caldithrix abyssi DSM 13497 TaxID=880073 RepID=A0A1J1CFX9_CALAY|nr:hypothetical protein Cabys_4119 [Caldithrix abyssi DSM 13497]